MFEATNLACCSMQVGCGAIGCELLKNYAMLGIGRKPDGRVSQLCNVRGRSSPGWDAVRGKAGSGGSV